MAATEMVTMRNGHHDPREASLPEVRVGGRGLQAGGPVHPQPRVPVLSEGRGFLHPGLGGPPGNSHSETRRLHGLLPGRAGGPGAGRKDRVGVS